MKRSDNMAEDIDTTSQETLPIVEKENVEMEERGDVAAVEEGAADSFAEKPHMSPDDLNVPLVMDDDAAKENLLIIPPVVEAVKQETTTTASSTTPTASNQERLQQQAVTITSLPMDSLHSIASFLTPQEWCTFGLASTSTRKVKREIIRRVRLHGFRCATEVVTAWKLGQMADARELAALYVDAGVDVYPRSLGHSYHTILWRMQVEVRQLEEAGQGMAMATDREELPQDPLPSKETTVDPFYRERLDFRAREGYGPQITYLAEKSLFWVEQKKTAATSEHRRSSSLNRAPSPVVADVLRSSHTRSSSSSAALTSSQLISPTHVKKIPIRIHQHLLNQHELSHDTVNDQDGAMVTPLVSLSADFFHPTVRRDKRQGSTRVETHASPVATDATAISGFRLLPDGELPELAIPEVVAGNVANLLDVNVLGNDLVDVDNHDTLFEPPAPLSPARLSAVLTSVEFEVYSSLAGEGARDGKDSSMELKRHLRSRFATYQRRLEAFLANSDHSGFDECMLDFWDEFFPHTAGIHYYDRHTPVPRLSCLQKFLTRPCPKAIGTVQCEIERIKITTRGKGVGMKGRLFPTYEYRLFIRNHPPVPPNENLAGGEEEEEPRPIRRDTVLMVAKNRGKKHVEPSGVIPASASTKKGCNNYYLYTPQQSDVDAHFNKVNETEKTLKMNPNGASTDPVLVSIDAGSSLLGRLQSNFIGTEFQIFTPQLQKRQRRKPDMTSYSPSEDELDYDSGVSSDNNSTRRSRFGRLSLLRGTNGGVVENPANDHEIPTSPPRGRSPVTRRERQGAKRSSSCSDLPEVRQARNNRRVANTPDSQDDSSYLYEEENGAITYTANLLGSRPRIMDVCIPRVSPDGVPAVEWHKYLESCDDTDDCRMLGCFRQLQQRLLENQDLQAEGANESESESSHPDSPEDFGLMALQNRPPWWNIELGSFVLNFGGRVSVASVKNFQLCERTDHDRIMLQFGRIQGRHSFTMDFQHPLTAVQAFSIAISSLQSRISFG